MGISSVRAAAFVGAGRGCGFAAEPGDGGLNSFAALGWRVGVRVYAEAAWATLHDHVVGGGVFIGEVVGGGDPDRALAER